MSSRSIGRVLASGTRFFIVVNVSELHSSNWAGVCYLTGGGSQLLSQLLSVPGASATILDAGIPYSYEALVSLLGCAPQQACSEITARNLAMRAYMKAQDYGTNGDIFGLGITASLCTNRQKRGEIRAFVALQTGIRSQVTKVEFESFTTRKEQEKLLTLVAYSKLCEGLGLASDSYPEYATRLALAQNSHRRLFETEPVVLGARTNAYLPGSFNPLHAGHLRMHELAQDILQCEVQYELSVTNVDKLTLDYFDLYHRLNQFNSNEVVLSNLPRFYQKAKYLRESHEITFVVGIDTLVRIFEPKFYETVRHLEQVIDFLVDSGTRFLVFGRTLQGKFKTIRDFTIPKDLRPRCRQVEASQFQSDLTSSALRSAC